MNIDGKKVRDYRIGINLNQYEYNVVQSFCALYGYAPAEFCRKMMFRQVRTMLEPANVIAIYAPNEGTIKLPITTLGEIHA